jgi:hypothetical protein
MVRELLLATVLATPAAAGERELRAYETATLGPAHAAEHARARAAGGTPHPVAPAPVPNASADEIGRWDPTTVALPTYAINAVMLPTGKVAFWGRAPLIGGRIEKAAEPAIMGAIRAEERTGKGWLAER